MSATGTGKIFNYHIRKVVPALDPTLHFFRIESPQDLTGKGLEIPCQPLGLRKSLTTTYGEWSKLSIRLLRFVHVFMQSRAWPTLHEQNAKVPLCEAELEDERVLESVSVQTEEIVVKSYLFSSVRMLEKYIDIPTKKVMTLFTSSSPRLVSRSLAHTFEFLLFRLYSHWQFRSLQH